MANTQRIKEYILRLNQQIENPAELYAQYQEDLQSIQPQEAFEVFRDVVKNHYTELEILPFLDKIVHVFYDNLKRIKPTYHNPNPFIAEMIQENELLDEKFNQLRPLFKKLDIPNIRFEMQQILTSLKDFYPHYEKKENLLFPLLEKKDDKFNGLTIMWALHNEIKREIDQSIELLNQSDPNKQSIIELVSSLFFDMLGLIQKEETILFPAALEVLNKEEWDNLSIQMLEYPGAFNFREATLLENEVNYGDYTIETETGSLRVDEVMMIFNTLELDMTYVDEHDKVRFFTRPKDRIFPRSAAVIGRDVSNCHPPQSVHIVEEIVENFRQGLQDKAQFWIDMRGRKILIQYFALRDSNKKYRGVLEVSSDITEIQKLQGQQRLAQYSSSKK